MSCRRQLNLPQAGTVPQAESPGVAHEPCRSSQCKGVLSDCPFCAVPQQAAGCRNMLAAGLKSSTFGGRPLSHVPVS